MNKTLASLLAGGVLTLGACNKPKPVELTQSRDLFVTTAENIVIEPHYGTDSMFMDGITVKRFAYGNGLSVPNINDSVVYNKGSKEYEALRHLLTVEVEKR